MKERKYTLPRHTILASQGSRSGAFLVDLAFCILLTIGLFFGVFSNVFESKTSVATENLNNERYASHLFFKDENDELTSHDSTTPNDRFLSDLVYFYTEYIPEKKDIEWFNKNVLDVEGDGRALFEYQVVDEVQDKTILAKKKEGATDENVNIFLQQASDFAINNEFNKIPEVSKLISDEQFIYQLSFLCSLFPSAVITYIVFPFILKNGSTLGKKAFGLSLATSDGYKLENWQVLLRFAPLLVLLASLFVPIWTNALILFAVFTSVFLVSFAISMASPKHMAIHDFCARTIVIDSKASRIFKNEFEEEKFIENEDEDILEDIARGEEPEISYEK